MVKIKQICGLKEMNFECLENFWNKPFGIGKQYLRKPISGGNRNVNSKMDRPFGGNLLRGIPAFPRGSGGNGLRQRLLLFGRGFFRG